MQSDPFLERLELLIDGKLEAGEVLNPLIDGLNNLLSDFELSLDHQPDELVDSLEQHLEDIADGVQYCLDLAKQALAEDNDEETLFALAEEHAQLNALLLEFHNASWIFRGPTIFPWVNMTVAAGERFLEGEPLESGLSYLLDEQAKSLIERLRSNPCVEGQAVISAVERLANWARGASTPTREELEDMLTILIGTTEAAQAFLSKQELSLDDLINILQDEKDPDTLLDHLEATRQELKPLLERVEVASLSSSVTTSDAAAKATTTLQTLYQTIYDIAQAINDGDDGDLAEPLLDLYDELQERMQSLTNAASAEGTAACPSCGTRNSRQARRCSSCSRVLAAVAGLNSGQLDITEGQTQPAGEEENVRRLRLACQNFQQGTITLEVFQGHVTDLTKLLNRARQGFQNPTSDKLPPYGLMFWEALDQIGQALDCLAVIELNADKGLDHGLQVFMEGVKKMRIAQEKSATTT